MAYLFHPLGDKANDYAFYTYNGHGTQAIDIGCPSGTPVYSMCDGICTCSCSAAQGNNAGCYVEIKSSNNNYSRRTGKPLYFRYLHFTDNSQTVKVNQTVLMGQQIGTSGNTGHSTGPHLHVDISTGSYGSLAAPLLKDIDSNWASLLSDSSLANATIPIYNSSTVYNANDNYAWLVWDAPRSFEEPTDQSTDDSTDNSTDDSTNDSTNNSTDKPANKVTIKTKNGLTYVNDVLVVNRAYKLPKSYVPSDLTAPAAINKHAHPTYTTGEEKVTQNCATAFQKMAKAYAKEKKKEDDPYKLMWIVSGYRSYNTQYNLSPGGAGTNTIAPAGASEHQTGLAVDVNLAKSKDSFPNDNFEDKYSDQSEWLAKNAYKYGFILRYPKGKEKLTGYSYEPWHYRFLGSDSKSLALAKTLYNSGNWKCLEEYFSIKGR